MQCGVCKKEFKAKSSNKLGMCPSCCRRSFNKEARQCSVCTEIYFCTSKRNSTICYKCERTETSCKVCGEKVQNAQASRKKETLCNKHRNNSWINNNKEHVKKYARDRYALHRESILQKRRVEVGCEKCLVPIRVSHDNVLHLCSDCKSPMKNCNNCNELFKGSYKSRYDLCAQCISYGVRPKECKDCRQTFYCNAKNTIGLCDICKIKPRNCQKCDQLFVRDSHFSLDICVGCTQTKNNRNMSAKRRSARINRTPSWADESSIREFYGNCPDGCHVDHIIPLQGKVVSGLHVLENLQYLNSSLNDRKGNRLLKLFQESTAQGPFCILNLKEHL